MTSLFWIFATSFSPALAHLRSAFASLAQMSNTSSVDEGSGQNRTAKSAKTDARAPAFASPDQMSNISTVTDGSGQNTAAPRDMRALEAMKEEAFFSSLWDG